MIKNKSITSQIIYKNNHVSNIYEACTCCYDNTKKLDYFQKKEYIEKRINAGHESILEHGRLAIKISNITDSNLIVDITTYEHSRYLEFYTVHKEDNTYVLIINGNMRAYKYFITNITTNDFDTNILVRHVYNILTDNTVGALYGTEFKLSDEKPIFTDVEYINNEDEVSYNKLISPSTGIKYDFVIKDKIVDIPTTNTKEQVKSVDMGIDISYFEPLMNDCDISDDIIFKILTTTVVFKNMSRTATHQLVRHRNAITQESQRYVDSSNATFTIPVPDYTEDTKYKISLFGQIKDISLFDLAKELMTVYDQLLKAGLKKEEARAFLPSNVNCRRLYMTFSISNLLAFLKLRTDEHAQYEIRQYAKAVESEYMSILNLV